MHPEKIKKKKLKKFCRRDFLVTLQADILKVLSELTSSQITSKDSDWMDTLLWLVFFLVQVTWKVFVKELLSIVPGCSFTNCILKDTTDSLTYI